MTSDFPEHLTVALTITRRPLSGAFVWFKNAWLLIRAQPSTLLLASAWIILAEIFFSTILSGIGLVLFLLITPAITFGIADVCQRIRLQESTSPLSIFAPLAHPIRQRLLSLGLFFAVLLFGCFLLSQKLIDTNVINDLGKQISALSDKTSEQEIRAQAQQILHTIHLHKRLLAAFGAFSLTTLLIQILLMYSPMFAVWQDQPAPRAVLFSVQAVFRNLLPIALATVLLALGMIALTLLCSVISLIIPPFALIASMIILILLNTAVNALTYTSYYDIIKTSMTESVHQQLQQNHDEP